MASIVDKSNNDEARLGGKALSLLRRSSAPSLTIAPEGWWGPLDGPRPDAENSSSSVKQPKSQKSFGFAEDDFSAATVQEVSSLRLKLAAVQAEIRKRDAALAAIPGSQSKLEDDMTRENSPSSRARRGSSLQLHMEGVLEDDGFVVIPHCNTFPGQDSHVQLALDIAECKLTCRVGLNGKGVYGAFVVKQGRCYYKRQTVSECRQRLVADSDCTTYLNSEPEAAALCSDIRRAVIKRYELQQQLIDKQLPVSNDVSVIKEAAAALRDSFAEPSESVVWRECITALEGEIRRKSAHSLELHRRVHALESQLQQQMQANDDSIESVKSTLEQAAARAKAIFASGED